ncbi:MAG: RHS repeat-associated core domain-containing protein [Saprospiraceae bacterium]|nr:RHS repeat-associated core domain-containing protein [Saprospiraceae bacterium]
MKTYINYQLATIILLISVIVGSSQNAIIPDILPSADAAALGKYGYFPVSYYSGQANINIPVHTLQANGRTNSIDLQYDGSGVLVNQHSGWIGQNWSLQTGGVITRSIQGPADEIGFFAGPDYYNVRISYITGVQANVLNEANSNSIADLIQLDNNINFPKHTDTEADIFNFNFLGKSGKFFLGHDGEWKVISDDNLKVIFDHTNLSNYIDPFIVNVPEPEINKKYEKVIRGFKIIDDEGYIYTFGYDPNAIEYSIPFFHQYSGCIATGFPNWVAEAWHLTKVEDYRHNVIFSYRYDRSYFTGQTFEVAEARAAYCKDGFGNWQFLSSSGFNEKGSGSLTSPVYLSSITSIMGDSLKFDISDAIQKEMSFLPSHQSSYDGTENYLPNCIPWNEHEHEVLPFLQKAGYYSFDTIAARTNPFKGLMWKKLDKISVFNTWILTKAYMFDYNNNINERLFLMSFKAIGNDFQTNNNYASFGYNFTYNEKSGLPGYPTRKIDHWGYFDGSDYYASGSFNFADYQTNFYPSRESNLTYAYKGMLTSISYPTGGRSDFEYELHTYNKVLSNDHQSLNNVSGMTGGLRIKSIKNYDNISVEPVTSKEYKYVSNYQNGGNQSSGILSIKPNYVWLDWLSPTESYYSGGYKENVFSNNSLLPLSNLFESPLGYREVVEIQKDSSYRIMQFTSHDEIKDELPYGSLRLGNSPYEKYTDRGFLRGRLTKELFYNNDDVIQKSIHHHIRNDVFPQLSSSRYTLTCDLFSGTACPGQNYYKGSARKIYHYKMYTDSMVTSYHYNGNTVNKTEKYSYFVQPNSTQFHDLTLPTTIQMVNSTGKNYKTTEFYPVNYTTSIPGQSVMLDSLTNQYRIREKIKSLTYVDNVLVDGQEKLYTMYSSKPEISQINRYKATWTNGNISGSWDSILHIIDYDTKFLTVKKQRVSGWKNEQITLNLRGRPTYWTYLSFDKNFQYDGGDRLQTFTDIDGQQKSFEYDEFSRLKKLTNLPINVENKYNYRYPANTSEKAYFKTRTNYPLAANSAMDSVVHIAYVDGLGRPIQAIHKYGAPNGADVITKSEYDMVGRNYRDYEAIPVLSNHGVYYTGAFSGGYTEQQYYADPLDRMSHHTPPAWQTTQTSYGTNTAALTNPEGLVYPASSLMLTTTTDPDGLHTDVYSDKLGKSVLMRRRGGSNTTDTWTVYDDKQRPVTIYPPGSSPTTPELIHRMVYDGDDNITWQKKPDATAEEYRYSERNLQTARRNAVLTAQGKWLVTHYDLHGRPTKRGYFTGADPGTTETPTISTLLEEYFYDGYNGSTTNSAPIYKGKLKKSRIKVLEDNGTNANWVETEYTYDSYGRVSTENITNHLGGIETKTYSYDFADNITTESHVIAGANGVTHVNNYTYDAQGRKIYDKVTLNSNPEITTASYNYDHKNQIAERNLGRFTTTGTNQYLQSLDYTYNAQGWLTAINALSSDNLPNIDPCDQGNQSYSSGTTSSSPDNDIFALGIDYNATMPGSGVPARQNGNITTLKWWHANQYNQTYSYMYDHLNRVTTAKHGQIAAGVYSLLNQYNEKFQYDSRGNILKLDRQGMVQRAHIHDQCYQVATIDSLDYIYELGSNRLTQVVDKAPCPDVITLPAEIDRDITYAASQEIRINNTTVSCGVNMDLYAPNTIIIDSLKLPSQACTAPLVTAYPGPCPQTKYTEGFQQQSTSGLYTYDTGGNMIYDPNKKLTFYYNYHNLPYKIVGTENDELRMLYDADGTLLQRKYIKDGVQVSKRDYLRGKEYKSDILESVYHSNGRIIKDGSPYKFEYHIKDHLGNVRVTFSDDNHDGFVVGSEIRSRNDYYAYGFEWNNRWEQIDTLSPLNLKRYNGKELFNEMNLGHYAYGKRFFDPVLGRFVCTDPISDQFPSLSSYNYASNNPIRNIDLHGLQGVDAVAGALAGNDDEGYIRSATPAEREGSPSLAGLKDASFAILDFIGLNGLDNAFFGSKPTNAAQKVSAVLPLFLNTRGTVDEGGRAGVKASQVNKNRISGAAREASEVENLQKMYPDAQIQNQRYLRTSDGKIAKDPLTDTGRRIDHVVVKDGKAIDAVETTSLNANKKSQIEKENRIRESGGYFVRNKGTRDLIDISNIMTRISRK